MKNVVGTLRRTEVDVFLASLAGSWRSWRETSSFSDTRYFTPRTPRDCHKINRTIKGGAEGLYSSTLRETRRGLFESSPPPRLTPLLLLGICLDRFPHVHAV